MLFRWCSMLADRRFSRVARLPGKHRARSSLALEALEDRMVLSTVNHQLDLFNHSSQNQSPVQDTRTLGSVADTSGSANGGKTVSGSGASGPGYPQVSLVIPSLQGQFQGLKGTTVAFLSSANGGVVTDAPVLGVVPNLVNANPTPAPTPPPSAFNSLGVGATAAANTLTPTNGSVLASPVGQATAEGNAPGSKPLVPEARTGDVASTPFGTPSNPQVSGQGQVSAQDQLATAFPFQGEKAITGAGANAYATVNPSTPGSITDAIRTDTVSNASLFLASVGSDSATSALVRLQTEEAASALTPESVVATPATEHQVAETITEGIAPGLAVCVHGSSTAQEAETSGSDSVWTTWTSSSNIARLASVGLLAGLLVVTARVASKEKRKRIQLPA